MQTRDMAPVPVRFITGDNDSRRDAFLLMLRLVVGHALAHGFHLVDIARVLGAPVTRLADWITGAVPSDEIEDMIRKCTVLAHGMGLDLQAEAG